MESKASSTLSPPPFLHHSRFLFPPQLKPHSQTPPFISKSPKYIQLKIPDHQPLCCLRTQLFAPGNPTKPISQSKMSTLHSPKPLLKPPPELPLGAKLLPFIISVHHRPCRALLGPQTSRSLSTSLAIARHFPIYHCRPGSEPHCPSALADISRPNILHCHRTLPFTTLFSLAFTKKVNLLIVISSSSGFVKTGLGRGTYCSTMPSTTARAGGVFLLRLVKSLSLLPGVSTILTPWKRKLGS
ncbi:hypothetical protein GBA52_026701 [Prunus armeniaca]|nr:hypothetical protein GBA52_026701 [Prunus armeniaca]